MAFARQNQAQAWRDAELHPQEIELMQFMVYFVQEYYHE